MMLTENELKPTSSDAYTPVQIPAATGAIDGNSTMATSDHASMQFSGDLTSELFQLRAYAVWLCGSKSLAEDMLQETALKAWAAKDRFESGTNMKAWCSTILRNSFLSYKRRSWRSMTLSDEIADELACDNEDWRHRLDLLALRNAMALLSLDQRNALLLVAAGGDSYLKAAKMCGCAVGTLKSRVSRARQRLAELLSQNKAGFNSDPDLPASDAMDDLLAQVSKLHGFAIIPQGANNASRFLGNSNPEHP